MSLIRQPSEDRRTIPVQRLWLLTLLLTGQLWAALSSLSLTLDPSVDRANLAGGGAFISAVLAIFALRTVPVRRIVRSLTLLSGLILAAFGVFGAMGGLSGSWRVLLWLGLSGVVLVLSPSSRSIVTSTPRVVVSPADIPNVRPDAMSATPAGTGSRETGGPRRSRSSWVIILSAASLLAASALLLGPYVANRFPAGLSAGDLIDRTLDNPSNVMAAKATLDMKTRPSLTDKVVLSVRSPLAMFWRTETFDHWDGQMWSRNFQANGEWVSKNLPIDPSPDDIAASKGNLSTQEFRLETGFATALPSASSPVEVRSSHQLARRADGTLVSPLRPLGLGATYTVESRQIALDLEMVSKSGSASDEKWSKDPVTKSVLKQFAERPVTTDRVRELAREVTKGARTDFQRISLIETWLGDNTGYSTKAPLAPADRDPVDDFLFNTKLGWCEQIASSLVVMAREVGVPARLVTGFVPGEWDAVANRFTVRERDAHAWAEVWFPEVGWVPFDPTSSVPFAGSDEARAGAAASDWREQAGLALLIVGVLLFAIGPVRARLRRMAGWVWRRLARVLSERRVLRNQDIRSLAVRLERIGRSRGRPRRSDETMTRYSAQVAELVEDPEVARIGVAVDREAYRPGSGGSEGSSEDLERILAGHEK
ncbi:MAG: transglutaminase domain-containing protein [Microthrixaceae bacterium]